MKMALYLVLLFTSSLSFARELKYTKIASDIRFSQIIDVSALELDKMEMLINKDHFGNEPCRLRFISYGPSKEISGIWFASIYDRGQTPINWTTFQASHSSGKSLKLASYLNPSSLHRDLQIGLDIVCWE